MNHLELFSGIGGFRQAMNLLTHDGVMDFHSIGYSEIDPKAVQTYRANYHPADLELVMGDIVEFTGNPIAMNFLPQIDLLSGGFPCQTFSVMGDEAGFEGDDRGQMFFRIMDIVNHNHPRYLLLENVKNLSTHDRGRTIARIEQELSQAGYIIHRDIFNTSAFGLPQTRNRTIIFARQVEEGDFEFSFNAVSNCFAGIDRNHCSLFFYDSTIEILTPEVDPKYYLSARIKPTILSDGSAGFLSNSEIDKPIARTLTATMHKMHRACQDNYFSDIYIHSHGQERPSTWMSKQELAQIPIRKLTPQEAFMLQGFPAEFATNAQLAGVSDGALYKQAGNAVSVNTIYAVLYYLIINEIIHE